MDLCLDIGCGRGYVTRHLTARSIKKLKCCEMSTTMLEQCQLPDESENIECEKINYDFDGRALPFERSASFPRGAGLRCTPTLLLLLLPGT